MTVFFGGQEQRHARLVLTRKEIFKSSPPPGNTVADLLGGASRPVSGRVSFA
jgi:hypothetical protein